MIKVPCVPQWRSGLTINILIGNPTKKICTVKIFLNNSIIKYPKHFCWPRGFTKRIRQQCAFTLILPKCLALQYLSVLMVCASMCIFSKLTRPFTWVLLPSWVNFMSKMTTRQCYLFSTQTVSLNVGVFCIENQVTKKHGTVKSQQV